MFNLLKKRRKKSDNPHKDDLLLLEHEQMEENIPLHETVLEPVKTENTVPEPNEKQNDKWCLDMDSFDVHEFNGNEVLIYSEHDIRIIFCGYALPRYSSFDYDLIFKVINESNHEITLQCDAISVNHVQQERCMSTDVNTHCIALADMHVKGGKNDIPVVLNGTLALCNDFLDDRRCHIPFYINLSYEPGEQIHKGVYLFDLKEYTALENKYNELLEENQKLKGILNNINQASDLKNEKNTEKTE